ncbi:protein-glucosylgalactosylhydroxylysine glucosidase isoform X1 [Acanthopagrus latus]|uniref:protein-glucosylgalactosylhydroxylysine glucosidase isoform X1 n=1 Tax=Acanthopagrus latus TaxID=8177 RepID=UPI00187CCF16|nr:protein-glucosylgalactosylhydroxylysine glucosidase isoform X1 [Acanthopagrus latus]XP_036962944.1 protein-glucosylgalactosylhydroxylysine glucosidase isoform X1 [Acanthopagrus latus]XP_036962945.1 protein-glucosylgalactosylhydroxylysine glucosidase isoform X1 [Acanthopagrus latus]XP_036962946.1 protein-glucosylgalactosylhydroxylysine glucosidase isoform X1 [Acanthopagrus latus]
MSCDSDPYIFSTDTLPADRRFLPPLANGRLGWRVYSNIMHMGGVYNGEGGRCHRADVPCPFAVEVETEETTQHTYSLDTHSGIFTHTLSSANVTISQSLYSHRYYSNLMVMEVLLVRQVTSEEPITVKLVSSFTPQSKDIVFESGPDYKGGTYIHGMTKSAEIPGGSCPMVHLIWSHLPSTLTLLPEQSQARWGFILVGTNSLDIAKASFDEGLDLMAAGNLRPSHENAWKELWLQSKVEVTGSETLSKAVIGCMFYLLSAFPSIHDTSSSFGGVSPGGLSNGGDGQDYWGHVFWDQDLWMYPGIALFYPKLARAVLEYRVGTIDGAKDNAQKQGHKGLKFPWESAVSGREVCPEDIYGQQEIHINGDVTLAFQRYLYLTEDLSMFTEGRGSEVIYGVADYWVSRVTWNPEDQKYHLIGVMPPDEYYYNVNNSVFTNTVAKFSLQFAVELAALLQHPAPTEWQEVADGLKIPFDQESQYHPEFDGYIKGHPVKQADAVMLSYPLDLPMSPEVRRNDLAAYEPVTDPSGPAMTWSMFAIGWMELGEAEKAQSLLQKCFKNIQAPFQVWSESSDGSGAVNFLTGMGGFLQAVLFGYTGFRVQKECLAFSPLLPKDISELCIRGVNYLGSQMDWLLRKNEVCIIVREQTGRAKTPDLQVVLKASGTKIPLSPGQPVTFPREPGYVCKQAWTSSCWPV